MAQPNRLLVLPAWVHVSRGIPVYPGGHFMTAAVGALAVVAEVLTDFWKDNRRSLNDRMAGTSFRRQEGLLTVREAF
jgi:hypothetical protein